MIDNEIKGTVVHGKGNGKKMFVPTANLKYDKMTDIENAVYVSEVFLDGKKYIGVTNIGQRPTMDNEEKVTIETHILDFDRDIYGKELTLIVRDKIRDIKKYESITDLKEQIESDISEARERGKNYV